MSAGPWTSREIQDLKQNAHLGAEAVALLLDRSIPSIKAAANRHRISLRPPGNRRGIVLGQPRGVRWMDQIKNGISADRLASIRQEALAGELDLAALEDRIRSGSDRSRATCPACAARPQEHSATGLCGVCHMKALAQAHRENHVVSDAKRELWRAKQEASRARRAKLREEEIVDLEEFDGDR